MAPAPEQPSTDARTLFVRNVGFDVDASQLEQVFADVGPVRQCFLVTDKQQRQQSAGSSSQQQQRHKGIAFVQFAIPEDAERALEELNGKELAGRRLKIEHALKRAPLQERKQKKRQAQDQHHDDDDNHDQQEQQEQQEQQQQRGKPAAKPAAAAAEQPPPKRRKAEQTDGTAAAVAAAAAEKHKWLRTVALGVPQPEVYLHTVHQLAVRCGGLIEVLDPPPAAVVSKAHLTQDGCSGHLLFLVFEDVKKASHAVSQLHGKHLTPADIAAAAATAATAARGGKGQKDRSKKKLSKKEAKKQQQQLEQQQQQEAAAAAEATAAAAVAAAGDAAAAASGVTLWARVVSGEGALVKKWRIILRNLAFQATESEVRKLLAPSGVFIWDLQIPRGSDGRSRGFAFASFTSYPDAEKAIKAANGQLLRKRPVAADLAIGKAQYEEIKGQQQQKQKPAAAADGSSGDTGSSGREGEDEEDEDEVQYEDGSESEEVQSEDEDGSENSGLSDTDEQEEEDEELLESEEEEDGSSGGGSSDDEAAAAGDGDSDLEAERGVVANALDAILKGQQQQQQPAKQQQQQQQAAAAKQQQQQQQQPAAAKQQQQQQQPSSGAVSRTVFVRGLPLDITSQELQARFDRFGPVKSCRIVLDKATGKPKGTAFIEYKTPEPAAAAAAACSRGREGKGPQVTVKGVPLNVDLALTQDDARRLGQQQTGDGLTGGQTGPGGKFDRRNLYLSKEGFVEEGSAVWLAMSENDRRKRKRAAEEKNQKLKSPNFAVSTTRLAVRNIPPSWDEKRLKAAFIAGVKERATKENPRVLQVKILRDPDRPDPSGHPAGRSRGFGFVEFSDHSHALAALRQLNNNPKTFGSSERRPIVEFACDNVKVLKLRQDKLTKQKQQQQQKRQQQQQQPHENGQHEADPEDAAATPTAAGREEEPECEDSEEAEQQQKPQKQQQRGKAAAAAAAVEQEEEKLTKRQIKRRKDKQRRQEKWQQQKQQPNGAAAAGGSNASKPGQHQQQQGSKATPGKKGPSAAAAAAAAASAAAKSARTAAKASRQQRQAAQEEVVRGKKRRADDLLDRLAALGDDGGHDGSRQHQRQQQQQRGSSKKQMAPAPAAAAPAGAAGEGVKKRHKPGRAAEERLDALVDQYKAKLFGFGDGGSAQHQKQQKEQQQQQKRSLQRWFE